MNEPQSYRDQMSLDADLDSAATKFGPRILAHGNSGDSMTITTGESPRERALDRLTRVLLFVWVALLFPWVVLAALAGNGL